MARSAGSSREERHGQEISSARVLLPAAFAGRAAWLPVLRGRCRRACCKSGAPVGADAIHQLARASALPLPIHLAVVRNCGCFHIKRMRRIASPVEGWGRIKALANGRRTRDRTTDISRVKRTHAELCALKPTRRYETRSGSTAKVPPQGPVAKSGSAQ